MLWLSQLINWKVVVLTWRRTRWMLGSHMLGLGDRTTWQRLMRSKKDTNSTINLPLASSPWVCLKIGYPILCFRVLEHHCPLFFSFFLIRLSRYFPSQLPFFRPFRERQDPASTSRPGDPGGSKLWAFPPRGRASGSLHHPQGEVCGHWNPLEASRPATRGGQT